MTLRAKRGADGKLSLSSDPTTIGPGDELFICYEGTKRVSRVTGMDVITNDGSLILVQPADGPPILASTVLPYDGQLGEYAVVLTKLEAARVKIGGRP